MKSRPFYCNYAVWNADVEVVAGTEFTASLSPSKDVYMAGEEVIVEWGVNSDYFTADSRVRITMSANYGESFDYLLAESVPARNGSCGIELPDVNVGNVDVDFVTAVCSMPGGIIRVEEIGGAAYALTALSPERGGSFCITGGTGIDEVKSEPTVNASQNGGVYDLRGRKLSTESSNNLMPGVYVINGAKRVVR
jgi:hypothetical protein